MNIPPVSNGFMPPHYAPRIQPTQQPGLPNYDMSQPNPRDTHFNNPRHPEPFNNNATDHFPITTSNVPQGSAQNVNPPSHLPFLINGQLPSWDYIWPWVIPPLPDRPCQHTSTNQNAQATGPCPTCAPHPTAEPFQFGAGQQPAAPAVQDATAPSAAAASSSSSSSLADPTAPHAGARPVSEAPPPLFRPGAGPRTSTENAYARKSRRVPPARNPPRRGREVPLVRIEDRIEWVSRDVMKMTVWFNWSPDAEAEAHEAWG